MFLVCFVSLPFLATQTYDLISNIMRGDCSETTSGSLLISSFFRMMKCTNYISEVNAEIYSLSEMDWATGTETYVQ